uniref:Uncharacterized protein n=1 Tax=Anguilla anguilla TaxID=7936 RepID=A0A0E9XXE0_ANGAN
MTPKLNDKHRSQKRSQPKIKPVLPLIKVFIIPLSNRCQVNKKMSMRKQTCSPVTYKRGTGGEGGHHMTLFFSNAKAKC